MYPTPYNAPPAPAAPPKRSLAVCFGGLCFFGLFMPFVWMVVTILATQTTTDHIQQESVGYVMIISCPLAGVVFGIAAFVAGLVGDPTRWLRRWVVLGVVGALLAVGFNAWMLHDSAPENRHPAPSRSAG